MSTRTSDRAKALALRAQMSDRPIPSRNFRQMHRVIEEGSRLLTETNTWADEVDSVSVLQAVRCWELVEWARRQPSFPQDLRL
jgi:hypothetical protein